MALVDYHVDEHVAVMVLNSDENRFNPTFLKACLRTLDEIEHNTSATTLIVRSAHEKIFSNGIDLEWLVPVLQRDALDTAKTFFYTLNQLFKRLLTYPLVTVAMINGHAFAGGAIMCCAFDFRFMRLDRGFFCLPEVDLGIPFLPGMNALLRKAIPGYKLMEMELMGNRLTAEDCEAHHIVIKACHMSVLMDETMAFAKTLNKERATVRELKLRLYHDIVQTLDVDDVPYIESGRYTTASNF